MPTATTIHIDGPAVKRKVTPPFASRAAELETIFNIELITVGTWKASTGVVKFTEEHLQSILDSQDDPFVKPPRLIIGHTPTDPEWDEKFMNGIGKDSFFGEQPTIGKFINLRLNDAGDTIVADLTGVPKWLAEILPTAFPNRSVEVYWNVKTSDGKEYAAIMPRVAALGINLPAVASLEDLQIMYSEEGPDGVELVHVGERVAARAQSAQAPAKFSIDVEAVRQAYYDDFAHGDRYWWWLKAMFVNPSIIIALDEDNGKMYSVPWSASKDKVEFGEPVEVFMQYVESESGKVAAQRAAQEAFLLGADIVYQTAAESRPEVHNKAKLKEQMNARARSEALARFVGAA